MRRLLSLPTLVLAAGAAAAQAPSAQPPVQSAVEALAQDAGEYARRHGVSLVEAMRRLRAQEESVAATDRIRETYRDRLAGISVEHSPEYRIVVLLSGADPVPDQSVFAGDMEVPIHFRTGVRATHDQLVEAMRRHRMAIRSAFPAASGLGIDQRTGELVMMVSGALAARRDVAAMTAELEDLVGVPARLRVLDGRDANAGLEGGARLEGVDPANGRRYACTTGFAVTDGTRTGIVTAAHCPDSLTYYDPQGGEIELDFVGQWGWGYRDVQVHVSDQPVAPLFYADSGKRAARRLVGWRSRPSTRAGDAVCLRGETTGYSCSEVDLTDYAPPGDLCGGPCEPAWTTVVGPGCRSGDSGAPVFNRGIAFGILKGANYNRDGSCNFYYYMSTDYLPDGWALLTGGFAEAAERR